MPGFEVFGEEERKAINDLFDQNGGILFAHGFDALRNGIYKVREFENAVSKKFNIQYAQAVNSGSAALRVALAALEVGPGDEVIIPAFTYVATAEAVIQSGADLVIVDIDESFNINPDAFKAAITSKTKVVIPVHMMGAPAEMDKIMKIASESKIKVIEDAAQGVGGTYKGRFLGCIGDLGCYSFDAGKVIITGEGGMVVTSDERYFKKSRSYHDHGHEYSSNVDRGADGAVGIGFNYRMMELQGAIGIEQLKKLEFILSTQRLNKKILKEKLIEKGFPYKFRKIHDEGELGDSLIFILKDQKQAMKYLKLMKEENITTKNIPDSLNWHFARNWGHMFKVNKRYLNSFQNEWMRTTNLLQRSIALPVMVKMTEEKIKNLAEKLLKISTRIQKN